MVSIVVIVVCTIALIWFLLLEPVLLRKYRERQLKEAQEFNRELDVQLTNERNLMEVAMRTWKTGKAHIGDVDSEGKLTIRELGNAADQAPAAGEEGRQ